MRSGNYFCQALFSIIFNWLNIVRNIPLPAGSSQPKIALDKLCAEAYTVPMSQQLPYNQSVPICPRCTSSNVQFRIKSQSYWCRKCGLEFKVEGMDTVQKAPTKQDAATSGTQEETKE